ncbi:MAG: tetratricopeptide repeat protein [Planctomycetes bacterium]|nr:tetratricopeptide repeat protein [Planctomycetota bacterium]
MKSVLVSIAIVLGLAGPAAFGQRAELANAGKMGLNVTSLEEVLRLPEEQIDLATATLISSEYWSDFVQGRRYLERLDTMALVIETRLRQRRLPLDHRAIPVINEYLFDELGFKPVLHPHDANDLFLHSVMDRREGYCLSLSILYLSIGERLGLDLYGVVVPGHFFVRYEKGRVRFNIETTSRGANPPEAHYLKMFHVPEDGGNSAYMKNLTKRQTLGCFFNNLGTVYLEIGDTDTALVALERAVAINPTLSESRTNLGNIYLQRNRVDDAVQQYRAALQLNPNDPKTHYNLGNAYLVRNELNAAASSYRQAIQFDPNFVDAHRSMAVLFTRQEQYGGALSELNRAIALDGQNVPVYLQLGDVYYRMGQYEKGLEHFRKAQSLKPNTPEAYHGMGTCLKKLGRVNEAIQALTQALVLKPDLLLALADLGAIYFDQGNYDLAIQYFQRAAVVQPDNPGVLMNLGSAYLNKGDFDQAVKAHLQAVQANPKNGDAHHALAYGFYQLGKYDLAWSHVVMANKLGAKVSEDLVKAIQSGLKNARQRNDVGAS